MIEQFCNFCNCIVADGADSFRDGTRLFHRHCHEELFQPEAVKSGIREIFSLIGEENCNSIGIGFWATNGSLNEIRRYTKIREAARSIVERITKQLSVLKQKMGNKILILIERIKELGNIAQFQVFVT